MSDPLVSPTLMAHAAPRDDESPLPRLRGRVGVGVRRWPRPSPPAPLLRASCPPPFGPAFGGSKSAPGGFVRKRERGEIYVNGRAARGAWACRGMGGISLFGLSPEWLGGYSTDLVRVPALLWCELAAMGFKVTAGNFPSC